MREQGVSLAWRLLPIPFAGFRWLRFNRGNDMEKISKVAVLVGSLRKDSVSRKVAQALAQLAPNALKLTIVEMGQLPFYNQDIEDKTPSEWVEFRDNIRAMDAVLVVTPEYNRSVPAVLKNAFDVGSRPYGKSVWNKKPAAVVSLSPGPLGGFGANHHIRQTLAVLNMPAMAQPEAYLGFADTFFDEGGRLVNEDTRKLLQGFMQAYGAWVATHTGPR